MSFLWVGDNLEVELAAYQDKVLYCLFLILEFLQQVFCKTLALSKKKLINSHSSVD